MSALKVHLTLPTQTPPHIPIQKFVKLISKDEVLLPETKVILEALKKAHQPYVPIPLQHEVIISPQYQVTLHKDLIPKVDLYTKMNWSENNKLEYKRNPVQFVNSILSMYNEMGYVAFETTIDESQVKTIIDDLDVRSKKMLTKLKKKAGI